MSESSTDDNLTPTEADAVLNAVLYYYGAHQDRGWKWPYYHDALARARVKLERIAETT